MVDLSEKFVRVQLNGDRLEREGFSVELDLMRDLKVRSYPTVLFFDPDGKPLQRFSRQASTEKAIRAMSLALEACGAKDQGALAPVPVDEESDPERSRARALDARFRSDPESLPAGQRRFLQYCSGCHGATGNGAELEIPRTYGFHPRDFTDREVMARLSDERLFKSIKSGRRAMPAFGDLLSDGEIRELVAYLRTLADRPK